MMPSSMTAQTNENPEKHRSPSYTPHVYISYDETTNIALICFISDANDTELTVCCDGVEVDHQFIDATAGTQIPLDLSAYSSSELTIQIRKDSTLLAIYSITL